MQPQPPKTSAPRKALLPAPKPRGEVQKQMLIVLEKSFIWAVSDDQLEALAGVETLMSMAQEKKVN